MPTFLCLLLAAINVGADNYRIEISEDSHQTVIIDENDREPISTLTTDVVPYNLTPDWLCNLGMQAGGLAAGDLDGDEDLAAVHFSDGYLRIYLNVDGQLETTPSWQYDSPAVGTALAFGDINGDNAIDLIMGVSGANCVNVFYNLGSTSIKDDSPLPHQTGLSKNYPNPFNAETRISFYLEKPFNARIEIFDLQGKLVRFLADGFYMAGNYSVIWDGTDAIGNSVAAGVYFYRLKRTGKR